MAETELSKTSTARPDVLSSVNRNGSGMDLAGVVTALVDAETVPQRVLTERSKEATETSISAYGTLKGKVSDLNTNLTSLEASSGRLPFSDSSKVFISVIDETKASDFIADVTVSQLAAGQVQSFDLNTALSSGATASTPLIASNATGTLTITASAWDDGDSSTTDSKTVTINSTNNTVEGLKNALNELGGIGAEIIDTGSGVKLLIKSETGTQNALTITTSNNLRTFRSDATRSDGTFTTSFNESAVATETGMTDFGVDISGDVLTITGDTAGDAGDLTFTLTGTAGTALAITVTVDADDTRIDLAGKIKTAIDSALGASDNLTATTTAAAGQLATGDGSGNDANNLAAVASTVTFSDKTEGNNTAVIETRKAADATLTIDGVTVTRSSNVIEDLYPGHQIVLTGTTAHNSDGEPTESFSVGSANTNSAAKTRFQDFLTHINDLKKHLNEVTEKGILGGEGGALAGDTAAQTILRRLSSFTTQPIAGYDTDTDNNDKPIYLAEMGIRTMIDGSLELYDEDRFDAALAENPNVLDPIFNTKFSSSSSAFSMSGFDWDPPDAGSYNFAYTDNSSGGTATLNGVAMSLSIKNTISTFQSAATDSSDPTYGIQITVLDRSGTTANVRYGVSLLDSIKAYADDLLGVANAVDNKLTLADREVELRADITEADATLAEIEAKVTELTDRYNTQFAAMEAAVTGFNATGEYMETLFDSWNNQNN
ncbi:MAG: flagellar filament capping protein FliD [Rhodobacteraceae bacterium]|nr:flagellar filament capping protein FliD [Paracoccaceae bacterium]